jgi:hypothetical protein
MLVVLCTRFLCAADNSPHDIWRQYYKAAKNADGITAMSYLTRERQNLEFYRAISSVKAPEASWIAPFVDLEYLRMVKEKRFDSDKARNEDFAMSVRTPELFYQEILKQKMSFTPIADNIVLRDLVIEGESAKAILKVKDIRTPIHFRKVGGDWRIDVTK